MNAALNHEVRTHVRRGDQETESAAPPVSRMAAPFALQAPSKHRRAEGASPPRLSRLAPNPTRLSPRRCALQFMKYPEASSKPRNPRPACLIGRERPRYTLVR